MKLQRELGSYGRYITHEYFSFQINGTSDPDIIRDGKTGLVSDITRVSAGLFLVTLNTSRPMMSQHLCARAGATSHATTAPTQAIGSVQVVDDYDDAAGTFHVLVLDCDNSSPDAVDPDDNTRIWVHITGSISSVGTDAA